MRILVTGGAGFIGSNLAEELVKQGHEVVVIDNLHSGSLENLKEVKGRIKIIKADCKDILNLNLSSVDVIFHFGIYSSSPMYKENPMLIGESIKGFIAVCEFAKNNNVKVIFASSSSIYSTLPTPHKENMIPRVTDYYTEARYCMERIAKLYYKLHNVNSVALRLFSVYGPHEEYKGKYANLVSQFLLAMQKNEQPVIYGDGNQTRDFVYVKDVVRTCLLAIESNVGCDVINIGTGKSTNLNELVDILNRLLGKDIKPTYVENPIKNYVEHTQADCEKSKRILKFKAEYSLEMGIKELIKYYQKVRK